MSRQTPTIREAMYEWLDTLDIASNTRENYRTVMHKVLVSMLSMPVSNFSLAVSNKNIKETIDARCNRNVMSLSRSLLRRFYTWLVERRLVRKTSRKVVELPPHEIPNRTPKHHEQLVPVLVPYSALNEVHEVIERYWGQVEFQATRGLPTEMQHTLMPKRKDAANSEE